MLMDEYGLTSRGSASTMDCGALHVYCVSDLRVVSVGTLLLHGSEHSLTLSVFLTGMFFFVIGSVKSRWSTSSWWHSGFTTLLVGGIAASLAYLTGMIFKRYWAEISRLLFIDHPK
jgi:hypothetical protein